MKKKRMTPAAFEQASVAKRNDKPTTSKGIAGSRKEVLNAGVETHETPPPPSGHGRLSGVAKLLGLPGSSPTCQSPQAGSPRSPAYHTPPASPRQARRPDNTSASSMSTSESHPATSASQSQGTPDLTVPLPQPATDTRDSTTSATDSEPNQNQGQPARVPVALRRLLPFNMPGSKEGDQQQRRRRE